VEAAVQAGAFPGAVVLIGRGDRILYHEAFGMRGRDALHTPMRVDTIFDLSSLTKALATTTA
jgi:CubicO group peptidase (beta-lactamase class C family)